MKYILLILFFLSAPVFAYNEYYFGIGNGATSLNIEAQQELEQRIDDSGYSLAVEALAAAGHPISFNFDLSSNSNRLFAGLKLNSFWDVEVGLEKLGTFSIGAALAVDTYNEDYGEAQGKVIGMASVNIDMASLSFIGKLPITKKLKLYNRLGAAYMKATVNTNINIDYSYVYNVDEEYTGENSNRDSRTSKSSFNTFVPVVGMGIIYDVSKTYAVRAEYSRSGNIVGDLYTESVNVELLYKW